MTYDYLVPQAEIITLKRLKEIVKDKFEKALGSLASEYSDDFPVAYISEDVSIQGNLELDTLFDELFIGNEKDFKFPELAYTTIGLVWISGSLTVSRSINTQENEDYSQCLIIEKELSTKNIIQGGISLIFLSDIKVENIFYYMKGAEGWYDVKGISDIRIEVDNNSEWLIKGEGSGWSNYEDNPEIFERILINPLNYTTEEEFLWSDSEDDFIKDLLEDKPIFKI